VPDASTPRKLIDWQVLAAAVQHLTVAHSIAVQQLQQQGSPAANSHFSVSALSFDSSTQALPPWPEPPSAHFQVQKATGTNCNLEKICALQPEYKQMRDCVRSMPVQTDALHLLLSLRKELRVHIIMRPQCTLFTHIKARHVSP